MAEFPIPLFARSLSAFLFMSFIALRVANMVAGGIVVL